MKFIKKQFIILTALLTFISMPAWASNENLRIDVLGLKGAVLQNVQTRLDIIKSSYDSALSPSTIQQFYKAAPKNIKDALEPYGYFKSNIHSQLLHKDQLWIASFMIDKGPPLRITKLDVQLSGPGQNDAELQKFINHFPLSQGKIFSSEKYELAKQQFFTLANNQGYLKAYFEKKIISIDLKNYTSVIVLHFNTGPRYYFGEISFDQKTFSDEFLRRFLPFHSGDPFSSDSVLTLQQNLTNSHYFSDVNVVPAFPQEKIYQIPVGVKLKANKSQQYNIGVGYGTFTGPRVTLGANFRHLTDTGHHIEMKMRASDIQQGLAGQYVIPGQNPLTDQYMLGINGERFLPKNGTSTSGTVFIGQVKELYGWKEAATLNYLREHYDIFEDPTSHNSRILYPSLDLSRTQSDNAANPTSGYKVSLNLRGSTKKIASNVDFVQTELKAKILLKPTKNSRVILLGNFGYTTVQNLMMLPLSLQFFAGGLESVRGYPTSYFGPGRYKKIASMEVQHKLIGDLYGAAFYDVGIASNHINSAMARGKGVGLVYNSVVGPIRLYRGFGYRQGTKSYKTIEFSIGSYL
ncbi:MAG: BamA/TamA family outer membrane protein [Gammaproteobacteria bacterium]|nr:BamA/TamA family outer membrane protein [Gammaproteobacteria bacterium]